MKQLLLTGIAFKILAFAILTPLLSLVFRTAFALVGESVFADFDILLFLLGPIGLTCVFLTIAMKLAFSAMELSSFLAIIASSAHEQNPTVVGSLRFSLIHSWSILRMTLRIIVILSLAALPFAMIGGLTFYGLTSEFDINYYLANRPVQWQIATVIWIVLGLALAFVSVRFFAGWIYALPLLLFKHEQPRHALQRSQQSAFGYRRALVVFLAVWLTITVVSTSLVFGILVWTGSLLVQLAGDSIRFLIPITGTLLFVWFAASELINLLAKIGLAAIVHQQFTRKFRSDPEEIPAYVTAESIPMLTGKWLFTRSTLVIFLVVAVISSLLIGYSFVNSVAVEDHIEIHAHRGSSESAPENTMAAIRQAIEDGADYVEIDVQELKGGEVVVFHDSDFMRQAGVNLSIWDATLEDIARIDIGSWFDPKFQSERAPLLDDVLQLCRGKIKVNIELKYYGHEQQLEQRVIELVESRDMQSDIVCMSLKQAAVKKMKSLRPAWKVGLLSAVAVGDLTSVEADFLAVNASIADQRLIQNARKNNKSVLVWTVNEPAAISEMLSLGVDGIITDAPLNVKSVVQFRAGLSPPERLLLEVGQHLGIDTHFEKQ